jgi:hypothetical protein
LVIGIDSDYFRNHYLLLFEHQMIKAGGKTFRSETHTRINYIWNKEELPEQWKESVIAPVYNKSDRTH